MAGAIVVFVLLWRSGCLPKNVHEEARFEREQALMNTIDSSQKAIKEHEQLSAQRVQGLQDSLDAKESDAEVYRYERDEAWAALGNTKKSADLLVEKIRELNGADSIACLELAKKYESTSKYLEKYKDRTDTLILKLDTVSAYKDSIIKEERELKKHALETGYATAEAYSALHASFKRLSPHASVWAGVEGSYSPFNQTVGGLVAFQTKKGTQYGLGVGMDSKNVGYYIKGQLIWKISFRKK